MLFYNEYANRIYAISHVRNLKGEFSRFVSGKVYSGSNDPSLNTVTWESMVSYDLEPLLIEARKNLEHRLNINREYGLSAILYLKDDWKLFVVSVKANFPAHVELLGNKDLFSFPEGW